MRRTHQALVVALVSGSLAVAAAPASAAKTRTCKLPPVDGAGFYGLKVRDASCKTGKTILRRIETNQTTPAGDYALTVRTGRTTWRCRVTFPAYEQALHSCKSGTRRVWLRSGA